ncbi:uncharacterized protein LOC108098862 isoform X2 [Drosophila ficusphila]|uniref:uncharacterized protein LOC108098862 isoform X2 n=1 Tax=Drosophila ficusphila TaxID=30025 RepID=UPI0007E7BDEA|nr:uncharacterized protein LOC108098862 isoform X2 [Drosophila ficusphila]
MDRGSPQEAASFVESRREILEIARNRPGTQVAKCILAYDEQQDLPSLIILLEELSKNTDYSTDLRISLGYYIEELLRHCLGSRNVSRRSAIVAAGSALQYCGKVYGDRVEYMYQVVEHQIEALLTSEAQKETPGETTGPEDNAPKPEEPRKRRAKKLTKNEVDPYLLTVEPRKFKTMSDEKRFNLTGFVKCTRNRTIEYLYQDHTPPNLWRHAPIVDPHNPYDHDEKKQYKMFTYHVEHRYNTLLPDIPFERLNLIKEYVHTNQVNTAEILNEHMTTKDYLNEYIELENQMLAARYGATVRTRRRIDQTVKRSLEGSAETELSKRFRLDDVQTMETDESAALEAMDVDLSTIEGNSQSLATDALQNQISVDSGLGDSMNSTQEDRSINTTMDNSQVEESTIGVSQEADSALGESQVQDLSQVENSLSVSQVENPPLSSTLAVNESSILDSTRLDLPPAKDDSLEELFQIDYGIGMDDISDSHLQTDQEDQRRISRISESINLPSAEAAGGGQIVELDAEVAVDVPREVCYPIALNILGLPQKSLRRKCIFKLTSDFDLFKQMRAPSRPKTEPKPSAIPRSINLRVGRDSPQTMEEEIPGSPLSLEFDMDFNFLGFRQRRPTLDSGFDFDDMRAESRAVSTIGEVKVEVEDPNEISKAPNETAPRTESGLGDPKEPEVIRTADPTSAQLEVIENSVAELEITVAAVDSGLGATISSELDASQLDNELEITSSLDKASIVEKTPALDLPEEVERAEDFDDSMRCDSPMEPENSEGPDSSSLIRDWHRRLAPALEAAHERQNFNIKDLGTEIIDVCKAGDGKATLADVMADKDPSIMCRYMLASLVLTNHGNVTLDFGNRDKSKPIEMSQFCMQLKSTKRIEIHPEDDVGNMSASTSKSSTKNVERKNTHTHNDVGKPTAAKSKPAPVKTKRKSTETASPEVFAKTVRLIQPIPKAWQTPSDDDSGISSMGSSLASTPRLN